MVRGFFPTPCQLEKFDQPNSSCDVLSGMQIDSTGFFEGGDATPQGGGGGPGGGGMMPPVPEPMSSSMALGLALFCLWGTYQLTRRERRHHGASA
jgi:hypothetical protein